MENQVCDIEKKLEETRTTDLGYLKFVNNRSDWFLRSKGETRDFRAELEDRRKKFVKISNDKETMLEISRRMNLAVAYLRNVSDKENRENCVYNAVTYYLNGNSAEAGNYMKLVGRGPKSFIELLIKGKRIRKAVMELNNLFRYMEQNSCVSRFGNIQENEEFYRGMTMLMNVKKCNKEVLGYMDSILKEVSKEVSRFDAMVKDLELEADAC